MLSMILLIILELSSNCVGYLRLYSFLILCGFLVLFKGYYINKEKEYQKNLYLYFIIYFVALISTIFLVNRFGLSFDLDYSISNIQLIPFKSLVSTLTNPDMNFGTLLFNYLGNFLMLMPFVFFIGFKEKRKPVLSRYI